MLRSMCQHVSRSQFDYCAKKHSLCGTVMIHDAAQIIATSHDVTVELRPNFLN